ncbi:hypothetical protein M1B74_07135 [Bacteroides pyogenes]|uniref:hypothetical protein n=1 Tax=Bacteroides pyogenes TaxID=310300 RepID=UPI003B42C30E
MKQYFIAICIVLLAMSCSDDSGKGSLPTPPAPPAEATLTLMIPGFRSASETRAGVHEEQISEIDVLLFRNVSGTERVAAMLTVPATSLHGTSTPGEARLTTSIPAGEYSRLALVVNAHTELTAAGITATSPGSSYTDLRKVQTSGRYGNLGFGPDKTIAMYGEYAPTGGIKIEAGVPKVFPGTVGLIRSMARVDFVNQETSPDFEPKAVFFNNVAGNGAVYVAPTAYGVDLDAGSGGSGYLSPTLPTSPLSQASGSDGSNGLFIEWGHQAHTYYLYEQPASGPSALSYLGITRPRIVLRGNYKGQNTWYPIDFTWDGVKGGGAAPYTKGTPMPILRNHRYIFTIKEVKGPGYLTWEKAFTAPEILANQSSPLTIETHVIDEAYTDVTFNNQGFLAVSRTLMTLKGKKTTASTDNKVEVLTNVAGGFRVQSFNNNGTDVPAGGWLRPSMVSGAANSNQTVQAITNGVGKKKGYLEVRAGRLYTKVNVEQIWKAPLELVAEYNLAGGYQYGSSFSSSDFLGVIPTSAQTDSQLRWAVNHNNDQSGYYNWYVCKGITHPDCNPDGKNLFSDAFFTTGAGKGYHLPSGPELGCIFPSASSVQFNVPGYVPNINEAIEFGDVKMTFISDYLTPGFAVEGFPPDYRLCYSLRFKQGRMQFEPDFPLAPDNSMACAYRYEIGGLTDNDHATGHLKVQCVFVGDMDPLPDLRMVIAREDWWEAQAAIPGRVVTRMFPAAEVIEIPAKPQDASGRLSGLSNAYFLSGSESQDFSDSFGAGYFDRNAVFSYIGTKEAGISLRLFADE